MKTAEGLVEYCRAQLGRPYWYGCYGQTATRKLHEYKKKQYPSYYKAHDFEGQYGQRVHDCVGLIKGYLWSDSPEAAPRYDRKTDTSANGFFQRFARAVRADFENLPDVPGLLVGRSGHIGVYVGGGWVIEAKGHAYGVVKTRLSAGKWTRWGYCTLLEYADTPAQPSGLVRRGDKGEAVRWVQQHLADKGYDLGACGVDGDFGRATEKAVRAFQQDRALEVDGIAGPLTNAQLGGD